MALALPASSRSLIVVAPLLAGLVATLLRRSVREAWRHCLLFGVSGLMIALFGRPYGVSMRSLFVCVGASVLYAMGWVFLSRASFSLRSGGTDQGVYFLLLAVLVCACGLTVLASDRMGWPAFIAMAGVLALTKREFESFALSRTAYEQTVRALQDIAEAT
jgi:drug/metabolite transporter (DMT)-like permease